MCWPAQRAQGAVALANTIQPLPPYKLDRKLILRKECFQVSPPETHYGCLQPAYDSQGLVTYFLLRISQVGSVSVLTNVRT